MAITTYEVSWRHHSPPRLRRWVTTPAKWQGYVNHKSFGVRKDELCDKAIVAFEDWRKLILGLAESAKRDLELYESLLLLNVEDTLEDG